MPKMPRIHQFLYMPSMRLQGSIEKPCFNCLLFLGGSIIMGKVLAIMKITPEDANSPIAELRQRIEK
ncbi:MAG: hypothetical protein ACFFDP_09610, partial [Promethearchaeota archaeon]